MIYDFVIVEPAEDETGFIEFYARVPSGDPDIEEWVAVAHLTGVYNCPLRMQILPSFECELVAAGVVPTDQDGVHELNETIANIVMQLRSLLEADDVVEVSSYLGRAEAPVNFFDDTRRIAPLTWFRDDLSAQSKQ